MKPIESTMSKDQINEFLDKLTDVCNEYGIIIFDAGLWGMFKGEKEDEEKGFKYTMSTEDYFYGALIGVYDETD